MELIRLLRSATQGIHRRLEQLPLAQAMTVGTVSRAQYRALLIQLSYLHRGLEAELDSHPELHQVYRPVMRRSAALQRDLQWFGAETTAPPLAAIAELVQDLQDWSVLQPVALLGSLYVVEGSRMGSMFLSRSLAEGFDIPHQPGVGLDYHLEGSEHRPQLWQQFLQDLIAAVPESAYESVVAAAAVTFQSLYDLFDTLPNVALPQPVPHHQGDVALLVPARS